MGCRTIRVAPHRRLQSLNPGRSQHSTLARLSDDTYERADQPTSGRPGKPSAYEVRPPYYAGTSWTDICACDLAVLVEYRTLGTTGIRVSKLCLGTLMLGAMGNTDHADSVRIISRAVEEGINFIDTADSYSDGEAEIIVGKALKRLQRDDIVLTSKVNWPMGRDPNRQGNSRRWIIAECENSLRRLGTDYIDLYQIHRPSPETDIDDTLGALERSCPRRQDPLRRKLQLCGLPSG